MSHKTNYLFIIKMNFLAQNMIIRIKNQGNSNYILNLLRMLAGKEQSQTKDATFSSMIINVQPVQENQEEYIERKSHVSSEFKNLISQSTYYQTHHLTQSQSPNNRKWAIRKTSLPIGTSPVRDKGLILKKYQFKDSLAQFQLSPQNYQSVRVKQLSKNLISQSLWSFSPRKQSLFRTRVVKPSIQSSLQQKPTITSQSYFAMWADSTESLLSCAQNERRQIASLTKIMTAFTVLSLCQQYNIKVREQWIPIHSRAHYMQGTSANLKSGQQILLIDLLYGLLLPSDYNYKQCYKIDIKELSSREKAQNQLLNL